MYSTATTHLYRKCSLGIIVSLVFFVSLSSTANAQMAIGDGNWDGRVTGTDYTIWLNNFGKTLSDGRSVGDYNDDGRVTGTDYVAWLNNFGKTGQGVYNRTSPWDVPGVIEAEDFDKGGQGVSYSDTSTVNEGDSTYRAEEVDLRNYPGKTVIGNVMAGEWVEYTVNIAEDATYTISADAGSLYSGRTMTLSYNDTQIAQLAVPVVTSWDQTQIVETDVNLPKGKGVLRVQFDTDYASVNKFEAKKKVRPTPTPTSIVTPTLTPTVVPTVVPTPVSTYPKVLQSTGSGVRFVETQAPQSGRVFIKAEVVDPAITDEIRFDWSVDGGTTWIKEYNDPFYIGSDTSGTPTGYLLPSNTVTFTTRFYYNAYNSNFSSTLTYSLTGTNPVATITPTSVPTPTPTPIPTVVALPSSTPAPTAPPTTTSDKLTWKQPTLVNPITITLGTGNTTTSLDNTKDYIIKLPNALKGTTSIKNGRNVVVVGGHISIPYKALGGSTLRAIYIKDEGSGQVNGRIVHLEGILIDASADNGTGGHGDALSIDAESAIVQFQNIRVDGMWGGQDTTYYDHSDLIQPWGGVKELRVDKLTGNTNYQGLQIPIDSYGPIGRADMRRVNISYKPKDPNNGGYLIWMFHTQNGSGTYAPCYETDYYPMNFSEFYLHDFKPGRNFGNSIWPEDANTYCGPDVVNGVAKWTSVPNITGEIRSGRPPGGDFVPVGVAGTNYVSPGYK